MLNKLLSTISLKSCGIPIWFMRQAGRYLPEYQMTKKINQDIGLSFMDVCHNAKSASEISMQPLNRFDLDAAIVFSDILVPLDALGFDVKFGGKERIKITHKEDIKTKIEEYNSLRNIDDDTEKIIENLKKIEIVNLEKLKSTGKTILKIKESLKNRDKENISVIGFCGSPMTVCCYAIQGGKITEEVKKNIISRKNEILNMINLITDISKIYLSNQIKDGADVIKLFESHAGFATISEDIYHKMVIKPNNEILDFINKKYPHIKTIIFPKGSSYFYEYSQKLNANCIAIDSSVDLYSAKILQQKLYQNGKIIQGNLDNFLLCYGEQLEIERQTNKVLETFSNLPFIFNLGHGILQYTDYNKVDKLIKIVRDYEGKHFTKI
jgi:uroporphyrinogen decarboxylase